MILPAWRRRFVESVYATHNSSPQIVAALGRCLSHAGPSDRILNVGSGYGRRSPKTTNFDYVQTPSVDCRGAAERLPFRSAAFNVIITQETLEHVREPDVAVSEMYRVLTPGGLLYCQVPFVIGYHPGPTDFWRFSREGIVQILERAGFSCDEIGIAVGPATGFYRIAVEFIAVIASRVSRNLYIPTKAAFALALAPVKLLDIALVNAAQADRIAGGYYVIARKPAERAS